MTAIITDIVSQNAQNSQVTKSNYKVVNQPTLQSNYPNTRNGEVIGSN